MRQGAALLVGRHDFAAFSNSGSPRSSTVRTVRSLHILARQNAFGLVVEGDGFLYNMVRTLAGTLLAVGRGRMGLEQVERALSLGRRPDAGPTAPACGLYLLRVLYPEPVFVGRDRSGAGSPGLFQV
jgi:tRNA pseudouridine38-40 synthase